MLEGTSMETLTLKRAAERLKISKNRIWRAVKDGHLPAEEGKVKGQTAFLVTKASLEIWAKEWLSPEELQALSEKPQVPLEHLEVLSEKLEAPHRHLKVPSEHLEVLSEKLQAPREHLEVPLEHLEVLEGVFEAPRDSSHASLSENSLRENLVGALERSHQELRQVERRAIELEIQLRQHRMLLTENAESLLEREALVKETQAKLQDIEVVKQSEIERLASELATAQQREAEIKASEEAHKLEAQRLSAELEHARNQILEVQKPKGFLSWLGLRKKRTVDASTDKAV